MLYVLAGEATTVPVLNVASAGLVFPITVLFIVPPLDRKSSVETIPGVIVPISTLSIKPVVPGLITTIPPLPDGAKVTAAFAGLSVTVQAVETTSGAASTFTSNTVFPS